MAADGWTPADLAVAVRAAVVVVASVASRRCRPRGAGGRPRRRGRPAARRGGGRPLAGVTGHRPARRPRRPGRPVGGRHARRRRCRTGRPRWPRASSGPAPEPRSARRSAAGSAGTPSVPAGPDRGRATAHAPLCQAVIQPASIVARATAASWDPTCSLSSSRRTWVRMVVSDTTQLWAIWCTERPRASSRKVALSRSVSRWKGAHCSACVARAARSSASSCARSAGSNGPWACSASPARRTSTSKSSDFERWPIAPLSSAEAIFIRSVVPVTTRTLAPPAVSPPIAGVESPTLPRSRSRSTSEGRRVNTAGTSSTGTAGVTRTQSKPDRSKANRSVSASNPWSSTIAMSVTVNSRQGARRGRPLRGR